MSNLINVNSVIKLNLPKIRQLTDAQAVSYTHLDGLDEVISQWMDAIRMVRIKRYIPDNLIPRDPDTGKLMPANPFDNDFIALGDNMSEKANQQLSLIHIYMPETERNHRCGKTGRLLCRRTVSYTHLKFT